MSGTVAGRRTPGRALWKSPSGRALLGDDAAGRVQGLSDSGTLIGIADLVTGLIGTGTGLDGDIEDLLASHATTRGV
ncbi:hypothetical protein [Amycolatopsis sp. NPDC051128]|uniref:hypothetical protein n=1 Tax=Amycolatopsis sp. NPDC051128 TaxID=3155412 RepID=UPI003441DF7B